jgi:low affinity Fe/Cu permease
MIFAVALGVIAAWVISGPIFHFSDTWQLVINTATTIVTFLMVFLIQNTQNRDTEAIQIKLDELIRATRGADNTLLDLEELEEEQLDQFRSHYEMLAREARSGVERGKADTGMSEI